MKQPRSRIATLLEAKSQTGVKLKLNLLRSGAGQPHGVQYAVPGFANDPHQRG